MPTDGDTRGTDGPGEDRDRPTGGSRRTPEQEQRAAERARRIRERRAAERTGDTSSDRPRRRPRRAGEPSGAAAAGTGGTRAGAVRDRPVEVAAARDRAAARERERTADPRYRRRRAVAVLATVLVVLIGVSAAGWWALGEFGPALRDVEVTGARQIPQRDVVDAAGVEPGVPLAAVDTAGVASRVSAIPGIASVDVGRSWPHTLTVTVTERTPAALVDTPDGRQLVDVGGYPYRPAPPDLRLPVLALPRVAPDDPATLAATEVLRALPAPVREQVVSLGLGPGGTTFELALTDDRRVLWGPWMDAAATDRRAAVLGPLLGREGSVYDVSSPDLSTVR